jgi:hypothetical protein
VRIKCDKCGLIETECQCDEDVLDERIKNLERDICRLRDALNLALNMIERLGNEQ